MKALIFFIILAPLVFMLGAELRDTPEELLTDSEKVQRILEDYTFNTPQKIDVLLHVDTIDNDKRERVKTIILKTDELYLPKSPKAPESAKQIHSAIQKSIPDIPVAELSDDKGLYFHWLTPNDSWTVLAIETQDGFYSRWERRADQFQATQF